MLCGLRSAYPQKQSARRESFTGSLPDACVCMCAPEKLLTFCSFTQPPHPHHNAVAWVARRAKIFVCKVEASGQMRAVAGAEMRQPQQITEMEAELWSIRCPC